MKKYNNISLFAGASIEKVSGSLGNFTVDVKVKPRYLSPNADPKLVRQAMEECTVSVPDPFYFGYQKRKAIYKNYPDAWPDVPVVLPEILENETDFKEKFKSIFNFNEQEQTLSLVVGSVLVTTGFNHYEPKEGEFGYKTIDNVITLPELNTLMELNPKNWYTTTKRSRISPLFIVWEVAKLKGITNIVPDNVVHLPFTLLYSLRKSTKIFKPTIYIVISELTESRN
jgi:heterodisulfide reductase subunit A-like polyferredoxin